MIDITNVYHLEDFLMDRLSKFQEYADVPEDEILAFIQSCLQDAEE